MQSSKMKAKDGSTIELVDNRISDANIASWNSKLNVDGSNATNEGVTAMMRKVPSGTGSLSDESRYFGDSDSDHAKIVRRPVLDIWNYVKRQISSVLGLTASEYSGKAATARAVVDYGATSNAIEIGWSGKSVESPTYFAVYKDSENGYNKAIKDCSLENARKAINGTSIGSTAVPVFINANGEPQVCTDDFMHDGDTVASFTGYNTSNIVAGSWYIIALKRGGSNEYERLYEFLISTNDNYAQQMRVLYSSRLSDKGDISDSKIFVSGHISIEPSLLANWKFATLKDSSGTTYTALCVKGSNSNKSRSVYWNVRSVRGNNDWNPVSINLNTNKEYTIISELYFNSANSLPNCITANTISPSISGNEFNASLPITAGATFNYLTQNTCNPSKPIILSCGGTNITSTGGSWTSTWAQKDCQLNGNGMLDVTASFGINIINQHTYVQTLTPGTCKICDWSGNVVKDASFSMPKHINNSLIYTVTDNISIRFVIPNCESKFTNGLKVVITLPSNYTIDDQVHISDFTLTGTYWRNGTGYNSNVITFDS